MSEVIVDFNMEQLTRTLRRFQTKTTNQPMDLLGQLVVNAVDEMFETEGEAGTDGGWDPLKDSTIMRSPRRSGGSILQDTGAMAAVQVTEVSGFSVTVGSAAAYSRFHLEGTKTMVKRDFFALNFPKLLDAMADLALQEYQR